MRPRRANVLLFVVLVCAFAGNDVFGGEPLPRVLPARGKVISLTRVPIEPARIITRGKVEWLLATKDAWTRRRIVWYNIGEPVHDVLNESAICRRIIGGSLLEPVGRIAFRQCEDVAVESICA